MLVTTPTQFYVVRFLLGVAEAGFVPGVLLYLTYWYPTYKRGKIIGLFMMGLPAAALLGSPISGWIMDTFDGSYDLAGWQWLYLLEALPSYYWAFWCFCFYLMVLAAPNGLPLKKNPSCKKIWKKITRKPIKHIPSGMLSSQPGYGCSVL